MISLYIAHSVISYFPVAGFKKHKNGATTELKLCCELPLNVKKKKNKKIEIKKRKKPTPYPKFSLLFCKSPKRVVFIVSSYKELDQRVLKAAHDLA